MRRKIPVFPVILCIIPAIISALLLSVMPVHARGYEYSPKEIMYLAGVKECSFKEHKRYTMRDFDGDDIPELFVEEDDNGQKSLLIYRYSKDTNSAVPDEPLTGSAYDAFANDPQNHWDELVWVDQNQWPDSSIIGVAQLTGDPGPENDYYLSANYDWLAQEHVHSAGEVSSPYGDLGEIVRQKKRAMLEDRETYKGEDIQRVRDYLDLERDWEKRNADGIGPALKYLDAVKAVTSLSDLTEYLTDPEKNPFCFLTKLSVTLDTEDTAAWAARVREDDFSVFPRIYNNGTREDIEENREEFGRRAGHVLKRAGYEDDEISRIMKECFELEDLIEPCAWIGDEDEKDELEGFVSFDKAAGSCRNYPLRQLLEAYNVTGGKVEIFYPSYLRKLDSLYTEENLSLFRSYLTAHTALTVCPCLDLEAAAAAGYADFEVFDPDADGITTEDGSTMDGSTVDGSTEDGSTEDTSTDIITTEDISTEDTSNGSVSAENHSASRTSEEELIKALNSQYETGAMSPKGLMGVAEENAYMTFFVDQDVRADLIELAERIRNCFRETLLGEDWLSEEGRNAAVAKLDNMTFSVLAPDELIDSSYLDVDTEGTYLDAYARLCVSNRKHDLSFAGTAREKGSWRYDLFRNVATADANAYYYGSFNQFFICAGFVTDTSYRVDMPIEEKLAKLGEILGHELTHGFDPDGIQYDLNGNMVVTDDNPSGWLPKEDYEAFMKRAGKVADYFDNIHPLPDISCPGDMVWGEAAADIGGLAICLGIAREEPDFDYDLFFRQHAQLWVKQGTLIGERDDNYEEHPLDHLRINTTVQQFDEFLDTYNVKEGDLMYLAPEDRISIW